MGIHCFRIDWVEYKEIYDATQVEHAPGTASIMGNVGATHVARNQDDVGVMRTDSRIEHRASATRSNHAEPSGSFGEGSSQANDEHNDRKKATVHRCPVEGGIVTRP